MNTSDSTNNVSLGSTRPGPLRFQIIHEGQQLIARRLSIASGKPSKHAPCDDHSVQLLQELLLAWASRSVSHSVEQRTKEHKQRPRGTRCSADAVGTVKKTRLDRNLRVRDHVIRIKFTSKRSSLRYNLLKYTITQNLGNARAHYHPRNDYQAVGDEAEHKQNLFKCN